MKTFLLVALVALLLPTVGSNFCYGIDSNRASSQARQAPGAANATANPYSDPSLGWRGTTASPNTGRDRFQDKTTPNWNYQPPATVAPSQGFQQPSYLPGQSTQAQTLDRWRLGIYPEDTDTGVRIAEVVRGSAAERAGLEVNDRIISVHGFQIGYVEGALYDVGQELERRADDQGWVRLLVQNNRDGQLMNLPVKLDGRQEALTGTITYRNRANLPQNSVATVELLEVLRADLQPITIARQTISPASRVPIPFKIEYDPSEVNSSRTYVMSAKIESNGRQIYATRQNVSVFGNKSTTDMQLLVESTSSLPGGAPNRNEQLAQITRWFREYLGREPRAQELYVWEAHLARGGPISDAQLQILSTPEFYYQAGADDTQYIYRMFQLVTQRQPSQQEVSQWLNRLRSYHRLRSELAREFLAMANSQASRSSRR